MAVIATPVRKITDEIFVVKDVLRQDVIQSFSLNNKMNEGIETFETGKYGKNRGWVLYL